MTHYRRPLHAATLSVRRSTTTLSQSGIQKMTVWFLLSLQLMGPSFLWLYLLMILLFMTPQTPLPQTPRTPLLKTPRTQPPRTPRKFSFLFLFIFYFFYPLLFPNSSKCPCFWALFVNTFYLWHLFNILHSSLLVFFAMC